ncbi:PH domain-containing protein [Mobilicoccus caccae]|uniref:YdbS-like PH domain-containing protein n=1 Tax=Mobilicoccus caccae TaxID=1859295 RepID=A0ABQ6ISZ0_9MICO|nr:PH domain-containing protein [Mobilicoccus caccae]GMA40781.1 hypothetical protein GCM10025883_28260 [Mobilicoccus caccae]
MSSSGHDIDATPDVPEERPRPKYGPQYPADDPGATAVSGVAVDARRKDTEWRRLDRRMLLIEPVDAIKSFLPLIIVVLFAGSTRNQGPWWTNLLVVFVPIVIGVWAWATTSYRITSEQLMLKRGIIQRTTHTARLDRVRTVDVTASLLQRLLGVASVKIGTGSETPFTLPGLATADAHALRAELLHVARAERDASTDPDDPGPVDEQETVLGEFSPAWIRYAPFSLTGLLAVLAVVGFAAQFFDDLGARVLESEAGGRVVDYVTELSVVTLVVQGAVLAVVVLTLAAVVTYVLRYWGYRLTRHPRGTLAVSRGLLTTRHTTLEERRLRGVSVTRPLLLRLVGAAKADALVTGLGGLEDSTSSSSSDMLTPPAPRAEVFRIAADVLRDPEPLQAQLRMHGPAARRRRHTRALIFAVVLGVPIAVATWWFDLSPYWYAVPAMLFLTAPIIGEARYRRLGHTLTAQHVVSRIGLFPESTTVVLTSAIIGWNISETFFQRRVGLVTLAATVAAGSDSVEILDIPLTEVEAIIRSATPGMAEEFMTTPGALPPGPR